MPHHMLKKLGAAALVIFILFGFRQEPKDSLHKRTFNVGLDEVRDGVPTKKMIPDVIEFKNGKLLSKYIKNKFGFSWIRYRVDHDTTYTDSTDTQVRQLLIHAVETDEKNQTVEMYFLTEEWDIDGYIRITKNDKLKKYYDFVGREKGGKPKKPRPLRKKLIEIQKEDQEKDKQPIRPPGSEGG